MYYVNTNLQIYMKMYVIVVQIRYIKFMHLNRLWNV